MPCGVIKVCLDFFGDKQSSNAQIHFSSTKATKIHRQAIGEQQKNR